MVDFLPTEGDELAHVEQHLLAIYRFFGTLGKDQDGRPTWGEMREFFEQQGITEEDEREVWREAFWAIHDEKSLAAAARHETRQGARRGFGGRAGG